MYRRGVALVPADTVTGVDQLERAHFTVTADLGQNRGCRNRRDLAIALDHRRCRHGQFRAAVAVDQRKLRCNVQAFDRALHGQHGGLQDIEPVDFLDLGTGDAKAQGLFANLVEKSLALGLREFFRIVQAENRPGWVEDHRCRYHRTAQRATAHFVNAGDQVFDQVEVQSKLHVSGP